MSVIRNLGKAVLRAGKRPKMLIALPKEYPQTTCGVVGCNNKLKVPNNNPLTSAYCEECKVKIEKELEGMW